MPLDPRGHLLYCTTLPREGVKAALPNTRKQTNIEREAAKTRKQRNMPQMKGQIKTPEKELNEIDSASDDKQSIRCRLQNTG